MNSTSLSKGQVIFLTPSSNEAVIVEEIEFEEKITTASTAKLNSNVLLFILFLIFQ